jgi:iron(III) transport system substrate-binding protein
MGMAARVVRGGGMAVVVTAVAAALALSGCGPSGDGGAGGAGDGSSPGVVNVYSHRHYDADRELFRRFTAETGIQVQVLTASADELITRLRNEGGASPADVLITVDAGRLHRAATEGLLQPVRSEVLERQVPAHLRDGEGQWYGLTRRARVIVYHRDRVDRSELSTYAALAGPEWRGRVVTRSSSNVYNQSLLAGLIARLGPDSAEAWARGLTANFARPPRGGDTDQLKLLAAGVGDVALVNTYYLARLASSGDAEDRRAAERLAVFFPDQSGAGTHINVSGAGVTRSSRNVENAVRLLEYLTAPEAQYLFAESNQEYPVNPEVDWSPELRAWGEFKADTLDLRQLGELNGQAVRMFDRVRWR